MTMARWRCFFWFVFLLTTVAGAPGDDLPVCIGPDCGGPATVPGGPAGVPDGPGFDPATSWDSDAVRPLVEESPGIADRRPDQAFSTPFQGGLAESARAGRTIPAAGGGRVPGQDGHGWRGSLSVGIESTSNVPAVSDELATLVGTRADHGPRWTLGFGPHPRTASFGSHSFEAEFFSQRFRRLHEYEIDLLQVRSPFVFDRGRHHWSVTPFFSSLDLGGRPFCGREGLEVRFLPRVGPTARLELIGTAVRSDYRRPVSRPAENRDGTEIRLGFSQSWTRSPSASRPVVYGFGGSFSHTGTRGSDFDSRTMGGHTFIRFRCRPKLTIHGTLGLELRRFDSPHSRDLPGRRRQDRVWSSFLRFDYRLSRRQTLSLSFADRQNGSNLTEIFAYRSRSWLLGLTSRFQ